MSTASTLPEKKPAWISDAGLLRIAIVLYIAFSLPYGMTKLSGDEVHFATVPYLILGGDYSLSAVREGNYAQALEVAAKSYALAWHFYVRPADANEKSGAPLSQYRVTHQATREHANPLVFTEDYFVRHRKTGKPLLGFLLNAPAIAATYALPKSLVYYQREFIYHPAFLVPRLVSWALGLGCLLLIYRFVRERFGARAAGRAAICFAVLPVTMLWSPDLHQDVPLTFLVILFAYFLWKKQTLRAAVAWGLAFGVKNQAVFALLPLAAEAIWLAVDSGTLRERLARAWPSLRALTIVFLAGLAVSAPFAHPFANLIEVVKTSATDIDKELQSVNWLFVWNPIWWGMGVVAILGLRFIDEARDSFDRYWIFFLILPAYLQLFSNTRIYMCMPAVAVLAGSYFRPKTLYCTAVGLSLLGLMGVRSPYLTIRGVGYRELLRDYPVTIGDIEKLRGVGSVRAEEDYAAERDRRKRRGLPVEDETESQMNRKWKN